MAVQVLSIDTDAHWKDTMSETPRSDIVEDECNADGATIPPQAMTLMHDLERELSAITAEWERLIKIIADK